jgi:alkylation response protein AidB-like acyl-CoA dehydrogenase
VSEDADVRELRAGVRELLSARLVPERLARAEAPPGGWDAPLWRELASLGMVGASLPEDLGGAGLGFREEAIVLEELAAAVAPVPGLATHLALPALRAAPDLARTATSGERPWTLVRRGTVEASQRHGTWRLSGRAAAIPDLWETSGLVVVAEGVAGLGLFAVVGGGHRERAASVDATRCLGRLTLQDTAARPLVAPGGARHIVAALAASERAALAAEALGVGRRALDLAIEHVRLREQFGRPVGAFQAVAHPLVDRWADLQLARGLVRWAAETLDGGGGGAAIAGAAAAAFTVDAAASACEGAIQALGALGVTWEHPLRRLYGRALWLVAVAEPDALRDEVAGAVLAGNGAGLE